MAEPEAGFSDLIFAPKDYTADITRETQRVLDERGVGHLRFEVEANRAAGFFSVVSKPANDDEAREWDRVLSLLDFSALVPVQQQWSRVNLKPYLMSPKKE